MYKVIGRPQSRALRIMWALEELGEAYELDPAVPRSETAFAHNPMGKVPSLIYGDQSITDSIAILTYLADKHGQMTHPAGTIARARQDAATMFAVAEVDAALWLKAKHGFVLPKENRVEAAKAAAEWEFNAAMKTLEKMLGDAEFIAGDSLTVPDIVLGHCGGWALSAKFSLPDGPVGDYFRRLRKRPAMQAAMTRAKEVSG